MSGGLVLSGKIVFIKPDRTGKDGTGKDIKKLQIMANGGEQRAQLFDVTDMSNQEWRYGADVSIPVSASPYQGRNGMVLAWTHWGGEVRQESKAAVTPKL